MDIVTHGMMGLALGGAWLADSPAGGCGFVIGSVLPDLDAFSRCWGKSAFLRNHQGWTHSLLVIGGVTILGGLTVGMMNAELKELVIGLGLGAMLHVLLDLTNTFGVKVWAPISDRRYCREWIFFIDAGMIGLTIPAAGSAMLGLWDPEWPSRKYGVLYGVLLTVYVMVRGIFRGLSLQRFPAGTVSAIPSALWPWEFLICVRNSYGIEQAWVNGITGARRFVGLTSVLDESVREIVDQVPEYQTMKAVSPVYHVIGVEPEGEGLLIRCRDLRTVNFNTEFGALEIRTGSDSEIVSTKFHV